MKQIRSTIFSLLLASIVAVLASSSAFGSATITIQNDDPAGVGFNDTTPAAPVGGNSGTTVGQQRLNAFVYAANIWGQTLTSGPTIVIRASWPGNLTCTSTTAVLGSASATDFYGNFAGAPVNNTWYNIALANALSNTDLNGSGAEIRAQFNRNIGTSGCLQSRGWYYGLDTAQPSDRFNLVTVLLHEFAHGLGFQTPTSTATGELLDGFPSVFDRFLLDNTSGKTWVQMTDGERVASAINTGNLVWNGPQATSDAASVLIQGKDSQGHPRMHAPNPRESGSSVSHWEILAFPNQLMEPDFNQNLSHSVTPPQDLTFSLLRDIGWCAGCPQPPPPPPPPPAPANDNFVSAQIISGCSGSVTGTNLSATREFGEPSHSPDGDSGGGSVWYQWQAPSNGTVTVTTAGSDYDTLLSVYTGTGVNNLTVVQQLDGTPGKNDDVDNPGGDLTSRVIFNATGGTVYRIAVDGWGGDTGNIVLNWTQSNCTATSYFVAGRVVNNQNDGVSGVLITFEIDSQGTPSTQTTQTDASGNYSSANLGCPNRVIVRPSKTSYSFSPLSMAFVSTRCLSGTATANFTATFSPTTPPPNTVQFLSPAHTVGEGIATALITVNRPDTTGAASVDYSTNDFMAARCDTFNGNASAKCDYATAGGTLRFAPGEADKTIVLSLVHDTFVEGNETLTITLSNAIGTTLGSPSTTTVTITDDDTNPNAENPFLNNPFFVRMQYLDFLLREPDSAGFNDWLSVLNNCGPGQGWLGSPPGCDRVHVSSGFFRSTEFGERGYWIYRFYESALGRRPQFAEFMPEMKRLSGLTTDAEQEARRADFISRFMALPEFTNIYQGLTSSAQAAQFIATLEQRARVTLPASANTEPGQPSQYGRQQLIDLMASGQFTAAQTLRAFIEQKVVWDTYFYRAFVAMQYFGYLRRDPEPAGYDDWVRVLTFGDAPTGIQPGDFRHLIFGFVYSVEYRERFGRP
jgi:hypothetical protein